jgi:dTDP-4-dehydrorhamnose reductase
MIGKTVLLGASGYIGQAFARELRRRNIQFTPVSRQDVDYSNFGALLKFLQETRPDFLVNAAGYTGQPNVDACEIARADTLAGNALLPATIAHACRAAGIPWGHVSSGCIFAGAKIRDKSGCRVEKDMSSSELKDLAEENPDAIAGFNEADEPNFSFRRPPCSFYSGSKAMGEEAIGTTGEAYVWRLRIPFDEIDNSRNYLSKVQRYSKVYDNVNSISHRGDFVSSCLDLYDLRAPFGIYNVTNPGFVTTRHVIKAIERILKPARRFEFWKNDEEFYQVAAKTPRSNCVMDVSKLLKAGVKIRSVEEALEHSLTHWKPEQQAP